MKGKDICILIILVSVLCVLGLAMLGSSVKGQYLIERLGSNVGMFLSGISLFLPFLTFLAWKTKRGADAPDIALLAFASSLTPLACILFVFLSALFAPLPGHVYPGGTKRILVGMTKSQVVETIGSPRSCFSGDHGERLVYRLQVPWGTTYQYFHVNLQDQKVVSVELENPYHK